MEDKILSLQEVATQLGFNKMGTLYKLLDYQAKHPEEPKLTLIMYSPHRRKVRQSELDAYIKRCASVMVSKDVKEVKEQ